MRKMVPKMTGSNILIILAGVVLLYAVYQYSTTKKNVHDSMRLLNPKHLNGPNSGPSVASGSNNYQPADVRGRNAGPASAHGATTNTYGLPPSCSQKAVVNPGDLLPADNNSEFSKANPAGAGDLQGVSLLKAGHHIGINTVGQSLRNANLQLRSEPPNPQLEVGPWNQSTIGPDVSRRVLEIGN